ncbi:hypothetical protein [Flammeovirga agarivorans]|uniref:Neuromedin U n=1 Tax=Flammeovirga agarivorans TaxID=2726742 RepID=A0A7X8SPT6_9BACT|nr:hypothetical protein [Flammeovirga agarivorans]NLR94057.1 hypothetical protein [Flammeovirga agarivorans]
MKPILLFITLLILFILPNVKAQNTTSMQEESIKALDPVANIYKLMIQNNMNIGENAGNTLWINPAVPIDISDDIKMINRFTIPISTRYNAKSNISETNIGNINYQAFLTNSKPIGNSLVVGIGPSANLYTSNFNETAMHGDDFWGLGLATAVAYKKKGFYAMLNYTHTWSVAGNDIQASQLYYILSYSFPSGFSISSQPTINYNSGIEGDTKWVVPVGLGVGQMFKLGNGRMMRLSTAGYYNAVRPESMAKSEWMFQFNVMFMLNGKKKK